MTKRQKELLNELRINMYDLALEAEQDEDFNMLLVELGIFSGSIDDVVLNIEEALE